MLTELRRINEHSKDFNKEVENTRKYQKEVTELKNTVSELENKTKHYRGSTVDWMNQTNGSGSWKTKQWNSPRAAKGKKS